MSDLTKIHAGLYRHEPTGRLIVRTEGWEGPRGGNLKRWEHADYVGKVVCIDGLTQLFKTRAAAVDALICIGRLEDLYEDAVQARADCDEDTLSYRLLDRVCCDLSEALRIAREGS